MNKKKVLCQDIEGNKKLVSVDRMSFRISAYGVLMRKNKVLLGKAWDGYDWPGGAINIGETIEEGLKREFWEETGLKIEMGEIVAVMNDFFIHPFTKKCHHTILLFYLCKNSKGEVSAKNFEKDEKEYMRKAKWVDIKKVPTLKFYNPVDNKAIIKEALKK